MPQGFRAQRQSRGATIQLRLSILNTTTTTMMTTTLKHRKQNREWNVPLFISNSLRVICQYALSLCCRRYQICVRNEIPICGLLVLNQPNKGGGLFHQISERQLAGRIVLAWDRQKLQVHRGRFEKQASGDNIETNWSIGACGKIDVCCCYSCLN